MGNMRTKKQRQLPELRLSRGSRRSATAAGSSGRGDEALAIRSGTEIDWSGRTFAMRFSARLAA